MEPLEQQTSLLYFSPIVVFFVCFLWFACRSLQALGTNLWIFKMSPVVSRKWVEKFFGWISLEGLFGSVFVWSPPLGFGYIQQTVNTLSHSLSKTCVWLILQSKFEIIAGCKITAWKCCQMSMLSMQRRRQSTKLPDGGDVKRLRHVHQIVANCSNQPDSWIDWWFSTTSLSLSLSFCLLSGFGSAFFFLSFFFNKETQYLSKLTRSHPVCSSTPLCPLLRMISRVWWHLT